MFNELLKLGREVLEKTEPGPNREDLQKDLNNLESRWTDVYYKTVERQEKLEEIVPLAQKYTDSVSNLLPWLTETEQMVADYHVTIVCEKHALIREQTFIKVCVLWRGFCEIMEPFRSRNPKEWLVRIGHFQYIKIVAWFRGLAE